MYANLSAGAIGVSATLEEQVGLAVEHGFRGCDVDLAQAEAFGIPQTRDLYAGHGLKMGGWGLPVEFHTDDEAFRTSLRDLPRWAGLAEELGCERCSTWVPSWSDERPFDEQFRLMRGRFRDCAMVLNDHGCGLGLEFLGPKTLRDGHQHDFISTLAGMLEMAESVGTGNVGLLLDAWHWYASGGTLEQVRALRNKDVVYVHINDAPAGIERDAQMDNVRTLPMETGVIDLPAFLQALDEVGYDGPVTTEPFDDELAALDGSAAVAKTKAAMERAWAHAGIDW